MPLQNNWTFRQGPDNKTQYILNLQPVMPLKIDKDWNLITRTVLPIISQPNMASGIKGTSGLGDTDFSMFLSPVTKGNFIWGVGPVISIPTSTDKYLGSDRCGLGPTIVLLSQDDKWTFGLLANQIWSFGGSKTSPPTTHSQSYSEMLLQPFISYSFWTVWNISFVSETTCDWEGTSGHKWTVPLDFVVSKIVTTVGGQAMSIGAGVRYFAVTPERKSAWGARLVISFLFPE